MATCRSISVQAWAGVFQTLVYFFSRHYQRSDAEDLAQQTLLKVLVRDDYEFREEDFKLVAYGFAKNILRAERRYGAKWKTRSIDAAPFELTSPFGSKAAENTIFLEEVLAIAREQMSPKEWELIEQAAEALLDDVPYNFPPERANPMRVALHRARKQLRRLTGHQPEV
jgi:DNA-directed RNA polymerase specialized sigma24 family protein